MERSRWNMINKEAFFAGLLRTLLESLRISDGETRLSFAEMKAKMQKAMIDQFEKFSAPNELWIFKNLGPDDLQNYANSLKRILKREHVLLTMMRRMLSRQLSN